MTDTEHLMRSPANRKRLEVAMGTFTPDEIHAAEIEAAREEGRRAGMMEAADLVRKRGSQWNAHSGKLWDTNVFACIRECWQISAAIEAKAKEG